MKPALDISNNAAAGGDTLPSRLPHRVGAVLAMVVFPLIWVGGLVTTYDAGMAVPDWPGTYGYNMFLYPIETWLFGPFDLLVEHGHRLLGSLAGLVAIVLLVVTIRKEPRVWVRWFAAGLLVLVICQGLLGGMRVLLAARTLAKIHGCVGPAFFACVVAFCVVTSRWWWEQGKHKSVSTQDSASTKKGSGLSRLATFLLLASFGQLVVGAFLRHISVSSPPNVYRGLVVMHIATAVLLLLGTVTQWTVTRFGRFKGSGIRGSASVLLALVVVQIGLGFGTWVVKFGWPVWFADAGFAANFIVGEKTFLQMNLITAHVAVGSLILAFWTIQVFRCRRLFSGSTADSNLQLRSKNGIQPISKNYDSEQDDFAPNKDNKKAQSDSANKDAEPSSITQHLSSS